MSRRAAVPQAEVERSIRALKAVGETIAGVENRPDGSVRILTAANLAQDGLSPLEAWEREHGDRAA